MHAGIVHLDSLIHYVTVHDRVGRALEPRSPAGDQYDQLAETVVSNIARERGLYLWGTYAPNGLWSNVYVGKASLGKTTHLYARILEELKDERIFLWGTSLPTLRFVRSERVTIPGCGMPTSVIGSVRYARQVPQRSSGSPYPNLITPKCTVWQRI